MQKSKRSKDDSIESGPVLLLDSTSIGSNPPLELMNVADAAAFLTISKSGMRRLQQGRELPFIRVGRSVRFAKHDLLSYLERRRVKPIEQ